MKFQTIIKYGLHSTFSQISLRFYRIKFGFSFKSMFFINFYHTTYNLICSYWFECSFSQLPHSSISLQNNILSIKFKILLYFKFPPHIILSIKMLCWKFFRLNPQLKVLWHNLLTTHYRNFWLRNLKFFFHRFMFLFFVTSFDIFLRPSFRSFQRIIIFHVLLRSWPVRCEKKNHKEQKLIIFIINQNFKKLTYFQMTIFSTIL